MNSKKAILWDCEAEAMRNENEGMANTNEKCKRDGILICEKIGKSQRVKEVAKAQ